MEKGIWDIDFQTLRNWNPRFILHDDEQSVFIDVGRPPPPERTWSLKLKITLTKSAKPFLTVWRAGINLLNVFATVPTLHSFRISLSIIWRKCSFSSSIFKAFICRENISIQQSLTCNWTMQGFNLGHNQNSAPKLTPALNCGHFIWTMIKNHSQTFAMIW